MQLNKSLQNKRTYSEKWHYHLKYSDPYPKANTIHSFLHSFPDFLHTWIYKHIMTIHMHLAFFHLEYFGDFFHISTHPLFTLFNN